eukprot:6458193-Amphidinium_carterae.1
MVYERRFRCNYRAVVFETSITLYKEETLFWARGHHLDDPLHFSLSDGLKYEFFLEKTHRPYQFIAYLRETADLWKQYAEYREDMLWSIHAARANGARLVDDEAEPVVLNVRKLISRCFLAAVALTLEHFAQQFLLFA